jgi:hypothetical protein
MEHSPAETSPHNIGMLSDVITDPAVLRLIAAARADDNDHAFLAMRDEYLTPQGSLGAVDGMPRNAFDSPEAPRA